MKKIDEFLNGTTMYRLMLYYLLALVSVATVFCFCGILPYSLTSFIFSGGFLILVSWITNITFAKIYEVLPNVESVYISALILALIITPARSLSDFVFLGWAAVLTMASKYIFTLKRKHLFNPVALAVTLTAYFLGQSATWWIGTFAMLPFVLVGGILIVRKIRRFDLVYGFLFSALVITLGLSVLRGTDLFTTFQKIIVDTPLLFFAFVMLTEPLTTPPTKNLQVYYGALVGLLFSPQIHLRSIYSTPEIALLVGNLFSYLVSPKQKLILTLKQKIQIAPDIYDLIFTSREKLSFIPGQYLEWTLGHEHPDARGNRRYFTIASSPTEPDLRVGVKFNQNSSSYKRSLLSLKLGDKIIASQLAGDFALPRNPQEKLVFIAGGIGVTPFRSMIKYLLDTHGYRDIILMYACSQISHFVYGDVFAEARKKGLKIIRTITNEQNVPQDWPEHIGRINAKMLTREIPDYSLRKFYLSGPEAMVQSYRDLLRTLKVKDENIVTDYFPGF